MKKVVFIINPIFGINRKPAKIIEWIDASWRDSGVTYEIIKTGHRGHGEDLAKAAAEAGADMVVAAGGDGTINEVGRGLLNTNAALGVIPAGSGNGFARNVKIPLDQQEAIEVLNTAFLKIFHSVQKFKGGEGSSFSGWMARIVFNTTMDHVRKKTKYRQKHDFETEADMKVENDVLGQLAAEDIYQYFQQLPAATRTVFNLFAIDGYRHKEIADMLDIDEGTSRWHVMQARKTLKKLVSDHYINA